MVTARARMTTTARITTRMTTGAGSRLAKRGTRRAESFGHCLRARDLINRIAIEFSVMTDGAFVVNTIFTTGFTGFVFPCFTMKHGSA